MAQNGGRGNRKFSIFIQTLKGTDAECFINRSAPALKPLVVSLDRQSVKSIQTTRICITHQPNFKNIFAPKFKI